MTSGSRDTSGTDGTNDASVTEERRGKRGIVNMLKVKKARTKGIVQKVNWNEMGQPIGKESMTLSHFLGSYARRNIPITCDDWRKKEWQNLKQTLWDEIKETFHGIEEEHRTKIVSRAGNLHRQFRTRLRNLAKDGNGHYSAVPPRLYAHFSTVAAYWKQFVENSMKEDSMEKSQKNKEKAQTMEARYKKACVGYARIREIIIQYKLNKGEKNPMVTRLDAWEYARRNADGEINDPITLQLLEDVGKNACYLYLDPGRRYVGRGILHNDLNDRILHGIPLEEGYVRVQFEVAEKSEFNTQLPRACDEANLVGEAPGYFLAWPRKLVSMKLETPPRIVNKEKGKHAMGQKKLEDKENKEHADKDNVKDKISESIVHVSSRQLGYPLQEDVCHDGVFDIVRLAIMFDRVTDIQVDMGPYWDADPWIEHINKENVLEVLDAQWLSASSLAIYIRYLCEVFLSKNPHLAAKFSFVSPHIVSHLVDNSNTSLAKCLLQYVDKDHLLFMPYNVSKHWVLVAINTATESIYFMDPAPMTNATNYKNVKALVETAMSMFRTNYGKNYTMTMFNSFRWTKVQCPKQALNDGIYCGYFVGSFIEDLLCAGVTKIDVNFTYTPRLKTYPLNKMVRFQKNWAGYLYVPQRQIVNEVAFYILLQIRCCCMYYFVISTNQ